MVPAEKILQTAREKNADIIGLSGLITPSLDEMVHVAKEMERQGFSVPLLIGGATTSKAHTAVKISPGYSQPVIHVLDASRAVGVVGSLLNPSLKPAFVESVRAEYEKLRAQHAGQAAKPLLTIEEARRRRTPIEWKASDIPTPAFTGLRVLASDRQSPIANGQSPITLSDLVPFIDWSPFFHTWELRGRYPAILEKPEAKKLFEDAQELLHDIVSRKLLDRARGVWLLPGQRRRRRRRALHRRLPDAGPGHVPFPAPANGQTPGPVQSLPRRLHRAEGRPSINSQPSTSRLPGRLRRDRRFRRRGALPQVRARTTTTTTRS